MKKTTKNKFFTKKKNKMKAWVPVTEVKTTMESQKEKEKQLEKEEEAKRRSLEEQQQQEEERKNKILSSLPPNYVTLAQLRENWLKKQQNEINQEDSAIYRHAIGVDSGDERKSVTEDEIGGGNEDLNGNVEESKESKTMMKKKYNNKNGWKKKKTMKAKVEEKGAIEEGGAAEEKTIMPIESKDVKNSNAKRVDEVEQEFRVLSVKSGNGKQNRKFKKMNDGGFRRSQSKTNNRNGDGHEDSKVGMIWVRKDNNVGEIET